MLRQRYQERGFAYLSLLIFLVILGVVSAAAMHWGAVMYRRSAEAALLEVGQEFSNALNSYSLATPNGQKTAPISLQELLNDRRNPGLVQHHLRKIYADPLTGSSEWGLEYSEEDHRITGIHSRSGQKPIKQAGFPPHLKALSGKDAYSDWIFTAETALLNYRDAVKNGLVDSTGKRFIDPRSLIDIEHNNLNNTSTATDTDAISPSMLK